MTPNDVQIDVLMRRYARSVGGASSAEHLDADELSAFAEGSLPPSARARYVSHLADCDGCRQLVSQLAISAGALAITEPVTAPAGARVSWKQRLAELFAPRTLRYAAFAMVLIAAVGVIFLVTRRPARNDALVAQNEKADQPASTMQPGSGVADTKAYNDQGSRAEANRAGATTAPAATPTTAREADDSKVTSTAAPATRPDTPLPAVAPGLSAKGGETVGAEQRPSYAPPPPGETQASGPKVRQQQSPDSRQQQTFGGLASGPRKGDASEDKYKVMTKQAPIVAKDGADESNRGAANQAPQVNRSIVREKRSGPSRNMDNVAATNENRIEAPKNNAKKETRDAAASESEEAPQTRSVGGRKFRRQGASWIDVKFKSSMSLITVTRGSQQFSSLDSGLRSIASQLSGEVIVVWKSKAYRIH